MLVISRKENECITIEPIEGLDPKLTLRDVFENGAVVVRIVHAGRRVRLLVDAPPELKIYRGFRPDTGDSPAAAEPHVEAED